MTFRSRRLLDLAHGMPCMAQFKHDCTAWQGCEPAHSDSLMFGRGHNHKSADWAFAAMCHVAHVLISSAKLFSREQKEAEWLRAHIATQDYLWTEGLIIVNPKRKVAA